MTYFEYVHALYYTHESNLSVSRVFLQEVSTDSGQIVIFSCSYPSL